MTKTGYSLKRPTLKANYVKILQAVETINEHGLRPIRSEVREVTGITHDEGFDKAVTALVKAKCLKEDKEGFLYVTNVCLLEDAAMNTVNRYIADHIVRAKF